VHLAGPSLHFRDRAILFFVSIRRLTGFLTETTVSFLKDAVLDNDWDPLAAPSSRIVVGKLNTTGTGSFDLLTNVPTQHYSVDGF
jgi:hypothetical protein